MSRLAPPLALAALFLGLLTLAEPYGEFPLNDDWVYAHTVRVLVEQGRLEVLPYAEAAHVAQAAWGVLFCLPAGFSHQALRLSTALLALIGVLTSYALLREAGAARALSFLGALTVAANPLYLSLSVTFMTDVPFAVFTVTAVLLLARGLRRSSWAELAAGTVLGVAALLTRQVGVLVFVAYGAAVLHHHGWRRETLWRACWPGLAGAVALGAWHAWSVTHGIDWLANDRMRELLMAPVREAGVFVWRAGVAAIYTGLFALPALLPAAVVSWRTVEPRRRRTLLACALFVAAVLAGLLLVRQVVLPLSGNVLFDLGLGALTLRQGSPAETDWPQAPRLAWAAATVLGVAGAALLPALAGSSRGVRTPLVTFVGVLALSYACVLVAADFFDRDLVLLIPLVLVLALAHAAGEGCARALDAPLALGGVLAALLAAFGVAATHDYFAWNRARWAALATLTRDRAIPPAAIDGGYEFNGIVHYGTPRWSASGHHQYMLTFVPVAGYLEVARFPYRRLVPPGEAQVFVLRRKEAR